MIINHYDEKNWIILGVEEYLTTLAEILNDKQNGSELGSLKVWEPRGKSGLPYGKQSTIWIKPPEFFVICIRISFWIWSKHRCCFSFTQLNSIVNRLTWKVILVAFLKIRIIICSNLSREQWWTYFSSERAVISVFNMCHNNRNIREYTST